MKVKYTSEKEVLPILIKDSSDERAEDVGNRVKKFFIDYPYTNAEIFRYRRAEIGGPLLILVSGDLGNMLDIFTYRISDESSDFNDYTHKKNKTLNIISDEEAEKIYKSKYNYEYTELDESLISIYS